MSKINIQVSRETHKELSKIGRKGQSFDDIVKKLIKFYNDYDK